MADCHDENFGTTGKNTAAASSSRDGLRRSLSGNQQSSPSKRQGANGDVVQKSKDSIESPTSPLSFQDSPNSTPLDIGSPIWGATGGAGMPNNSSMHSILSFITEERSRESAAQKLVLEGDLTLGFTVKSKRF